MTNNNYKKTIFSWSIYDFANQPFTTIILTFIYSTFFTDFIASSPQEGAILWGRAVAISSLCIAFLSPIMGAIADNGGYRKIFLIFWSWVCIIFSYMLYFPKQGDVYSALIFFLIANIGFEMGGVFLNAYLPEIAPRNKIGRISGYGWSFGYIGGLIALGICYLLFINPEIPLNPIFGNVLDKSTGEHIRIINIFIAFWFALFSLPTFIFVKDTTKKVKINLDIINKSFSSIKKTFKDIKEYKQIIRFLLARLIYNDALITIFAFGGIYAKEVFNFSFNDIFLFGIILNITAGLGAFLFGFLDDAIGSKKTIQITNVGFILACFIAFIAPKITLSIHGVSGESLFWLSGCLIGVFSGPNQAASRSFIGRLIPKNKENEFYGFFAFSGKATAFLGPLIFSVIVSITGSLRWGIFMICILFFIGFILLSRVNEESVSLKSKF